MKYALTCALALSLFSSFVIGAGRLRLAGDPIESRGRGYCLMGAGISSLTMIVGLFMLLTSGSLHTHSTYLELVLDQCNAKCIHRPVVVRGLCSWPASENDAHRIRLKERCPDALSIVYNLYKEADGQPCLKYDDGLDIIDGSCVEVQHKKEPIKLAGAKESPTPLLAKLRAKIRKKRTSRARTFSYSTGKLK